MLTLKKKSYKPLTLKKKNAEGIGKKGGKSLTDTCLWNYVVLLKEKGVPRTGQKF